MLTKGTIRILAAIVVVGGIVAAAVAGWMVFQPGPYAFATGTPVEFAAYRGGPSPAGIPAELANADAATKGAYIARMARSSLLEVVREDYVRTARAKGLPGRLVISLHALPNALLPVITLSGILLGFVLAGSIPVERAFATPGLGYAMYTAVSERDVFVMQNLVLLYAVVFVVLNIGIDVIIAWLDPRIRYR